MVYKSISFIDSQDKEKITKIIINKPIPETGYELWSPIKKEQITLDSVVVRKTYMTPDDSSVKNNFILFNWNFEDYQNSGQITITFPTTSAKKYEPLFEQILSTFKLIN